MFVFLRDCDRCNASEERVFTDSWTGKSLCLRCLSETVNLITNSPATEKDNLEEIIDEDELDDRAA